MLISFKNISFSPHNNLWDREKGIHFRDEETKTQGIKMAHSRSYGKLVTEPIFTPKSESRVVGAAQHCLPLLIHSCHPHSHHYKNWLVMYAALHGSFPIFSLLCKRDLMLWALVPLQILPTPVPVNYPGRGQAISFPIWFWNSLF